VTGEPTPGEGDVAALGDPRPLTTDDVGVVASAIARAFAWHEPWGGWALPDPADREARLRDLVADDLRSRFLPRGECWTIGGFCATLWIPPPSEPGAAVFEARRGEAEYAAYGDRARALRAGDALVASLHPGGEHWYLDAIATDPRYRRRGLGARLLDHDLAIRDERGQACALDTHTPANVAFYERRGFEVVAEATLPEGGPDLYVMVREPGAGRRRPPPAASGDGE
jgi:ribosomal protein S18 acetylase RimI-like enzyme